MKDICLDILDFKDKVLFDGRGGFWFLPYFMTLKEMRKNEREEEKMAEKGQIEAKERVDK